MKMTNIKAMMKYWKKKFAAYDNGEIVDFQTGKDFDDFKATLEALTEAVEVIKYYTPDGGSYEEITRCAFDDYDYIIGIKSINFLRKWGLWE